MADDTTKPFVEYLIKNKITGDNALGHVQKVIDQLQGSNKPADAPDIPFITGITLQTYLADSIGQSEGQQLMNDDQGTGSKKDNDVIQIKSISLTPGAPSKTQSLTPAASTTGGSGGTPSGSGGGGDGGGGGSKKHKAKDTKGTLNFV